MYCILILLVAISSSVFADSDLLNHSVWSSFKVAQNKEYDPQEESRRQQIFTKNLNEIEEHNALYKAGNTSYKKGVNQFTDLTEEEFEGIYLTQEPVHINASLGMHLTNFLTEVPESIDYRQIGAVNPIRWQGNKCGSCWAFAAVASLESHNFLRTKTLLSLSEQNLVDCDLANNGCIGGLAMRAFDYIRDNGLESESDYPYTGKEGKCQFSPSKSKVTVQGIKKVNPQSEDDLKSAVGTIGPVIVSIDGNQLRAYESGIFSTYSSYRLNHAVVVVGYGSENGKDYWIIRNCWGDWWGEKGYCRIARNEGNQLGMLDHPVYPVL